jgi:hypothetical protein
MNTATGLPARPEVSSGACGLAGTASASPGCC